MNIHGVVTLNADTLIRKDYEVTDLTIVDDEGNKFVVSLFTSRDAQDIEVNTSRKVAFPQN